MSCYLDAAAEIERLNGLIRLKDDLKAEYKAEIERLRAERDSDLRLMARQNADDDTKAFASLQAQARREHDRAEAAEAKLAEAQAERRRAEHLWELECAKTAKLVEALEAAAKWKADFRVVNDALAEAQENNQTEPLRVELAAERAKTSDVRGKYEHAVRYGEGQRATVLKLDAKIAKLVEALEQIAKGEGRFNRDPMTHAENTIEDMQVLAVNALAAAKASEEPS